MDYLVFVPVWVFPTWIILCILVGFYAKKNGRHGFGYFILSVLLSPLVGFIILLIIGDTQENKKKKIRENIKLQNEVKGSLDKKISSSDRIERLSQLSNLLEKGLITREEFENEKKALFVPETIEIPLKEIDKQCLKEIDTALNETKKAWFAMYDEKIIEVLRKYCTSEDKSLAILAQYEKEFGEDLVKRIMKLSSSYDTIERFLSPFIEQKILSAKYPHERINRG